MVWAIPRSLATTSGIIIIFFSCRYWDVSVPCVSLLHSSIISLQDIGLSHSEIFGSKVICTYPKLIAAYHVLHRLWEPRHPPCALAYFLLIKHFLIQYKYRIKTYGWYILLALTKKFTFCFCTLCQRSLSALKNLKWRITDSNRWPSACKADALASWANPPNQEIRSPRQSWTADLYIISVAL